MAPDTISSTLDRQHALALRKLMEDTIKTMSAVVEKRDNYTWRHQLRVAELATAIAVDMQWPEDRVLGLKLAGSIHDLGKIFIPFEILSKPGKLNRIEFNMVKEHPRIAFEILTNMDFCWPINQIIYQHHERLDGSGYPGKLTGNSILPEARILAVADTVEAMSFDRPYRPALGIENALSEINAGSKQLYDAQAVDTCTRLFGHRKFRFTS